MNGLFRMIRHTAMGAAVMLALLAGTLAGTLPAAAGSQSQNFNCPSGGGTAQGAQNAWSGGTPTMATYWWSGDEYYCIGRHITGVYWRDSGGSWNWHSDYDTWDYDIYVFSPYGSSGTGGAGTHYVCASYGSCAGYVYLQAVK